jgi:hypothetical protein
MTARQKKTREIRFRGSPLDQRRLAWLARHFELTPSATLRRLIAEAFANLVGTYGPSARRQAMLRIPAVVKP